MKKRSLASPEGIGKYTPLVLAFGVALLLPEYGWCLSAGLGVVNTVAGWLQILGVGVASIATMWSGYKVMFQGMTIRDVAPTFLGGTMIGSASGIAGMVIGG